MAEDTFQPELDSQGRVRLDRKLNPVEAREQDERHRKTYAQNRARRFTPAATPRAVKTIERELKAAQERTGEDTREDIARLRQELAAARGPEAA